MYFLFDLLEGLIIPLILWLIVVPIFLIIKTNRLGSRVRKLEEQLAGRRSEPEVARHDIQFAPAENYGHREEGTPLPVPLSIPRAPGASAGNHWSKPEEYHGESAFLAWLKEDVLVKTGAFLLLLGLAWFVSYAFANNYIGPVGRITLGLMLGVGILIFGSIRLRLYQSQGAIFTVLGSTVVILTVSADRYLYDLFNSEVALGVMFLMVVYVAFVSVHFSRVSLAYASLISALLAPLLINHYTYDPIWLMSYLLLIVLGTLFVVWFLRAPALTLTALLGVILYTQIAYQLDQGATLLFAFIFTGIFFVTNCVSLLRRASLSDASPVHVLTALITGVYLIAMTLAAAPEEWVSAYLLLWCVVFAYGSFQVFIRTEDKVPFYIYAGVSVVLLGSATAIELEGPLLTIMLTLEVLASIVLMSRVVRSRASVDLATFLLVIPGLLTLGHLTASSWREGFLHGDALAVVVFIGALIAAAYIRETLSLPEAEASPQESGSSWLFALAGVYALIFVWLFFHSIFDSFVGTLLSLVSYSVIGLVLFLKGRNEGHAGIKTAGMLLLIFVVGRLLLVDVWTLDTSGRIVTFLVIGLLFISTAFLPKPEVKENN